MHGQLQIVVFVIHTWAGYSVQLNKHCFPSLFGDFRDHNMQTTQTGFLVIFIAHGRVVQRDCHFKSSKIVNCLENKRCSDCPIFAELPGLNLYPSFKQWVNLQCSWISKILVLVILQLRWINTLKDNQIAVRFSN